MAIYRYLYTKFWEDDKILDDMSLEEKFFYIYLLTNPRVKQCGCYEISFQQIFLQTNLSKEKVKVIFERFENELNLIKYSKKTKEILLLNFYKYNWTPSFKIKSCIEKELKEIKEPTFIEYIKKMIGYRYPIDTLSIPLGEKEKEKEKEKENKKERESSINNKYIATPVSIHPPTLFELRSFCQENDMLEFDCNYFFDYYEANGWVNANGTPIKNWKAKVKKWYADDLENGKIKKIDNSRRLG